MTSNNLAACKSSSLNTGKQDKPSGPVQRLPQVGTQPMALMVHTASCFVNPWFCLPEITRNRQPAISLKKN